MARNVNAGLVVVGLTGLVFVGGEAIALTDPLFMVKHAVASGQVVELRASGGRGMRSAVVRFKSASGREHTFMSRIASTNPQFEVGDTVPVDYDETNLAYATIARSETVTWKFAFIGLGMIAFSLVFAQTRRHRKRAQGGDRA